MSQVMNEIGEEQVPQQKKKKLWLILLLFLLLFTGGGTGIWYYKNNQTNPKGGSGNGSLIFFDDSAQTGNLPGKTIEQIQEELNKVVEEGMFNISIAADVYFEDGNSEGKVRIENIKANPYHMQVSIVLDENKETVYESKAIKPEQYIESIKLNKDLSQGKYPATAIFKAIDQETLDEVGTAAAKITLIVEN